VVMFGSICRSLEVSFNDTIQPLLLFVIVYLPFFLRLVIPLFAIIYLFLFLICPHLYCSVTFHAFMTHGDSYSSVYI
jgi:hypothetical protein